MSKPETPNETTRKAIEEGRVNERNDDRLQRLVGRIAGHIRNPYTLGEIVALIESDDYNAEMMLQHLLRWVAEAVQMPTLSSIRTRKPDDSQKGGMDGCDLTPVELVDAVYEMVFVYKPESPAQEAWKRRWLANAKRYGAGFDF